MLLFSHVHSDRCYGCSMAHWTLAWGWRWRYREEGIEKKTSKQLRITIRGKTPCVLLHFDSSKRCVCPLYKFLYAFKVVKLFLKHPVYDISNLRVKHTIWTANLSTVKQLVNMKIRDIKNVISCRMVSLYLRILILRCSNLARTECDIQLTLRWLMSYIYGAPILDVSRSHTTTQHSW